MEKTELMKEFQKKPERYWKVKLFQEKGFKRKRCANCGKYFWTLTEQAACNDSSCRTYDFIGKPLGKRKMDYFQTWNAVRRFFKKNKHAVIKPYPVVCRWFPLYFTIAGIVNFSRMSGQNMEFEVPANPSITTQPCLRFNDVQNVGINSKSYTAFLMIQQTSLFNKKTGYWKDSCMDLDFEMLTKVFGIPQEEIVFIEDVWLGPNAFGSSLEYHVQGLELGNAVFTEFSGTPGNHREMDSKVIDMGAGHERFTWISQGTPTSYDCVFGDVAEKLKKACDLEYDKEFFEKYAKISGILNVDEVSDLRVARETIAKKLGVTSKVVEQKVSKLEAIYAIADHSRALLFALTDSGLPSNVGGGYNLRVILRRALSFAEKLNIDVGLQEIVLWHAKDLKKLFPEIAKNRSEILKILDAEEKRYIISKERGKKTVETMRGREIGVNELIKLYDSEGIAPEQLGIEVPANFYKMVTESHMKETPGYQLKFDLKDVPKTEILFYNNQVLEFKAKVLKMFEGNYVALDKTSFYPESGGQLYDRGTLNGIDVVDVKKVDGVILHKLAGRLNDKEVFGVVDRERRETIMRHHTATHIIGASARKVLGNHVWQAGSEKTEEKARLDISHFQNLTQEEIEKIENLANRVVAKNIKINKFFMQRPEAEEKYGFVIYQGGPVPEKVLRIVEIPGVDVEACGGTHCDFTGEIDSIKILKAERIADGVVRLEFVAGRKVWEDFKKKEALLRQASEIFSVPMEQVPGAAKRFFEGWKESEKELSKLRKELAFLKSENIKNKIKNNKLFQIFPYERQQLIDFCEALTKELPNVLVVLANPNGDVVGKSGSDCAEDAVEFIKKICEQAGGSAGGADRFAQGKGDFSKIVKIFEELGK